ncbi:MAG: hypothetical protein U1A05_04785, partial [Alphaproteobacteria bacterium]|nr:hypothetical protein [Alphaproteobacteria bacterium]
MFKKNLYSFCAVLALSSNAYAILGAPDEFDLTGGRNALRASQGVSASSPASSTQSSLFLDDEQNVTFTWLALQQAGSYENPNPDLQARDLYGFLQEMFSFMMRSGVHYKLPISQEQLGNVWALCENQELLGQIRKAIEEANASSPASSTQNLLFSNDDAKVRFAKLEAELEASRAQTAAKEELEKRLTARFAALEAEFKKFKEDTDSLVGGLRTS